MNHIFDTHAHYSSRQFDADRAALLKALPEGGVVGVLECATHSGNAARVLELAHAAPYIHAAIGIHPESLIEEDAATVAVYHGDWRAELAAIPHDRALLETDCPYMSPEPVRGTRNDSRNIAHVAAYIGTIWDVDAQAVLDQTAENARRCFGL